MGVTNWISQPSNCIFAHTYVRYWWQELLLSL